MFTRKCILRPRTLPNLVFRNDLRTQKKVYYSSRIVFSSFLAVVIGVGCALTYANYNPQIRDNLKKRSVIMNEIIQFMWQEKKTFKQRIDEITFPTDK